MAYLRMMYLSVCVCVVASQLAQAAPIQGPTIQDPTSKDPATKDPKTQDPVKMDLLFIVDSSAGVGQRQFHRFKRSMKTTVRNFPAAINKDNVRVAMIMFSDEADTRVVFHLDNTFDKEEIIHAIGHAKYTGNPGRMMGKALGLAKDEVFQQERGSREDAHQLVFLMTTGPSDDPEEVKHRAAELLNNGVELFATGIAIDSPVDKEELSKIVSAPPETHLYILQAGP
ncbi:PREDICTED: collagen alpha-3(VI) chain-like [Branchiostoma belcheri]|uniref:Collagen alpha-3(VI) chain-like n=1 Tax=Branchiostoma belcheri TaxID=7741 RepID=A0A6P5AIM4_BRABE|nr:PREDICTED: collagen alpha-3(VI) chain-like [Branchiostoma belcheri]